MGSRKSKGIKGGGRRKGGGYRRLRQAPSSSSSSSLGGRGKVCLSPIAQSEQLGPASR